MPTHIIINKKRLYPAHLFPNQARWIYVVDKNDHVWITKIEESEDGSFLFYTDPISNESIAYEKDINIDNLTTEPIVCSTRWCSWDNIAGWEYIYIIVEKK